MTAAELDAIEARANGVRAGTWPDVIADPPVNAPLSYVRIVLPPAAWYDVVAFVTKSFRDIPRLVQRVRELEAEVKLLREGASMQNERR